MEKITFKRESPRQTKSKRHSVVVKNETYMKIVSIKNRTGIPVETIVNRLLDEALRYAEVTEN